MLIASSICQLNFDPEHCSAIMALYFVFEFQLFLLHIGVHILYQESSFDLFVWGFSSHSRIFLSYGDVTISGEGLQILAFERHMTIEQ